MTDPQNDKYNIKESWNNTFAIAKGKKLPLSGCKEIWAETNHAETGITTAIDNLEMWDMPLYRLLSTRIDESEWRVVRQELKTQEVMAMEMSIAYYYEDIPETERVMNTEDMIKLLRSVDMTQRPSGWHISSFEECPPQASPTPEPKSP